MWQRWRKAGWFERFASSVFTGTPCMALAARTVKREPLADRFGIAVSEDRFVLGYVDGIGRGRSILPSHSARLCVSASISPAPKSAQGEAATSASFRRPASSRFACALLRSASASPDRMAVLSRSTVSAFVTARANQCARWPRTPRAAGASKPRIATVQRSIPVSSDTSTRKSLPFQT